MQLPVNMPPGTAGPYWQTNSAPRSKVGETDCRYCNIPIPDELIGLILPKVREVVLLFNL